MKITQGTSTLKRKNWTTHKWFCFPKECSGLLIVVAVVHSTKHYAAAATKNVLDVVTIKGSMRKMSSRNLVMNMEVMMKVAMKKVGVRPVAEAKPPRHPFIQLPEQAAARGRGGSMPNNI